MGLVGLGFVPRREIKRHEKRRRKSSFLCVSFHFRTHKYYCHKCCCIEALPSPLPKVMHARISGMYVARVNDVSSTHTNTFTHKIYCHKLFPRAFLPPVRCQNYAMHCRYRCLHIPARVNRPPTVPQTPISHPKKGKKKEVNFF